MKSFSPYPWATGKLDACDPNFPSDLSAWDRGSLHLSDNGTHFVFVQSGVATLATATGVFDLCAGMYAAVADASLLSGGRGIAITRRDHQAFFHVGGPVERQGRLKYIDGCTDSLLIPPVRLGDPCLNLLYFPPGIDQTQHTHPSDRIGVIHSGRGQCITPEGVIDLEPGMIFRIHAEGIHSFRTPYGQDMRVIAYHPDSDFGPTDEAHPMINRTIVDGISAAQLPEIQTR